MFSAVEIISKIESGQLTALEVTQACLDVIEATDSKIRAWEYINREAVISVQLSWMHINLQAEGLEDYTGFQLVLKT